jgi:hypothetical protein
VCLLQSLFISLWYASSGNNLDEIKRDSARLGVFGSQPQFTKLNLAVLYVFVFSII